jgi:zinc transporter, ZIP family
MFSDLPAWLQAGLWGLIASSSLLLGAALAYLVRLPDRFVAGIMAFGCGVLICAITFELIMEGYRVGGLWPIIGGSLAGSLAYAGANALISRRGGAHRKRSGEQQSEAGGAGPAIAIGSLLDGIPESIVLGIGLLGGEGVSIPVLAAIFLSNLPEGLCSAAGMRKAGRSAVYVFGLWGAIVLLSAGAAALGAGLLGGAPPMVVAFVNAGAAGGLLTMIVDTMIPEAVEGEGEAAGLLVVVGLLAAFVLSHAAR